MDKKFDYRFRVWNGERMVSPDYVTRDGIAHWKENSIPESSDKIMLFTGLYDKKGREIFAEDIIKTANGSINIVRFGTFTSMTDSEVGPNIGFYFDGETDRGAEPLAEAFGPCCNGDGSLYEVIGHTRKL
jgi:hypothetical protein